MGETSTQATRRYPTMIDGCTLLRPSWHNGLEKKNIPNRKKFSRNLGTKRDSVGIPPIKRWHSTASW